MLSVPRYSDGEPSKAGESYLEGWVQHGVHSLRAGKSLPPLAKGQNPLRVNAFSGMRSAAALATRARRKRPQSVPASVGQGDLDDWPSLGAWPPTQHR
jgi:hypothetical protein